MYIPTNVTFFLLFLLYVLCSLVLSLSLALLLSIASWFCISDLSWLHCYFLQVYICEKLSLVNEMYFAITLDRKTAGPVCSWLCVFFSIPLFPSFNFLILARYIAFCSWRILPYLVVSYCITVLAISLCLLSFINHVKNCFMWITWILHLTLWSKDNHAKCLPYILFLGELFYAIWRNVTQLVLHFFVLVLTYKVDSHHMMLI